MDLANSEFTKMALAQIEELLDLYDDFKSRAKYDDLSDLNEAEISEFIAAGRAAVYRISGENSDFAKEYNQVESRYSGYYSSTRSAMVPPLAGLLKALEKALKSGYLVQLEQLVHADTFTNILDMAQYLLEQGFKDAAAVLAGGVLEVHLKNMAQKYGIETELEKNGRAVPKHIEILNHDLAREGAYTKYDQRQIGSWYALRNHAAHGQYDQYDQKQVENAMDQIRDFITRHPA